MRQIKNNDDLALYIKWCENNDKTIGLVPTMGALHHGHLSLVNLAKEQNDVVIVSVFVNPTQFNNPTDLEKYPRTLDEDSFLLAHTGCDVIYAPAVSEVYPDDYKPRKVELGRLNTTLEGHYRPGHFEGVVNVVQRLFDLVQPSKGYFGRKDFQQVAVIKTMVNQLNYPIEIMVGETIREDSGLALSSRNALLSKSEKKEAISVSKVLFEMKNWAKEFTPTECQFKGKNAFEKTEMKLEYLDIVHPLTFENLENDWVEGATACIVAYCGNVRLIDNLELISCD